HPLRRQDAAHGVERRQLWRIRVLLERESERRPSALEPGDRAPDPELFQDDEDPDVQRLRRSSCVDVRRHGSEEVLLVTTFALLATALQCNAPLCRGYWRSSRRSASRVPRAISYVRLGRWISTWRR